MNNTQQLGSGSTVLVAEDDPGMLQAMTLAFELEDFKVVSARDGQDALEQLASSTPDLIITDLLMPRMNGAKLIEHVRSNPAYRNIPVLLISAALPKHVDASIADAYLRKPTTIAELLQSARQLLNENKGTVGKRKL